MPQFNSGNLVQVHDIITEEDFVNILKNNGKRICCRSSFRAVDSVVLFEQRQILVFSTETFIVSFDFINGTNCLSSNVHMSDITEEHLTQTNMPTKQVSEDKRESEFKSKFKARINLFSNKFRIWCLLSKFCYKKYQ